MEPKQVVAQFLQLPIDAQRIVADLIAYLDRRETQPCKLDITALAAAGEGATMLPALDVGNVPDIWPENSFANPAFQGGWADWDKPDFDFREWRRQIWERPKAQP